MSRVARPIVLDARPEFLKDLAHFVRLLGRSPDEARIRIEIPRREMQDDRPEVHVTIGNLGVKLPTYRGWVIDDVSPKGIHHTLSELLEHGRSNEGRDQIHERAISRHVRTAMIVARHDDTLPPDLGDECTVDACLDPDGELVLWADMEDRYHRVTIDHDEMRAVIGEMPIPCHIWQTANGQTDPVVFLVVGPSMSEDDGIEMELGRGDPVEIMRTVGMLREHREAE